MRTRVWKAAAQSGDVLNLLRTGRGGEIERNEENRQRLIAAAYFDWADGLDEPTQRAAAQLLHEWLRAAAD